MSGKPPSRTSLQWIGDHAFQGGRADGPPIIMDGDGVRGPSPVDTLLLALAACTGYDVVDILAKRRTPVESLHVDIHGDRLDGVPARVTRVTLTYDIQGAGIELAHAERAVDLAVNKYCSVRDTIDPDLPIETVVRVNAVG